jgi:hypothetical protein
LGFKHWMWMIHASCSSMPCQKMTSERDPEITARYLETEAGYQRLYQMIRALRVTNEFVHQAESTHRSTVFSAHGSNMNHTEAPHWCEQSWYHAISFVWWGCWPVTVLFNYYTFIEMLLAIHNDLVTSLHRYLLTYVSFQ